MRRLIVASLLTLSVALASFSASAADFAGKTITLMVPFPTGGGVDLWARFNAPLLARHLPGKPSIVVKNSPGGGSTSGANLFTQIA